MNLSLEVTKAIIFAAIGAFIYSKVDIKKDASPPAPPAIVQTQTGACKATIKKHTNADGSVDEVTEFLATNSQKQEVTPPKPQSAQPQDFLSVGGYVDSSFKGGGSLGLKIKDYDFDFDSDLKKDHRVAAKWILLKW